MTVATAQKTELPAEMPQEVVSVRRFGLPDLQTHGLWLYEKLQKRFPHVAQSHLTAWICGAIETNQFFFICTDKAVGMAQANHRPLEPVPFVDVVFVESIDAADRSHEPAIYRDMTRWGKSMNASELNYGELTPEQITAIKGSGADLYKLPHYFTPID